MRSRLLMAQLVLGLLPAAVIAQTFLEVEPNDSKAAANIVNGLAAGGGAFNAIQGVSTAVSGAGLDYYRITVAPAPPGIYRHRLVINSATPGHTGTIRGINQTAAPTDTFPGPPWDGVVGSPMINSDTQAQGSSATTSPPRFNQWYGFGQSEQFFYRVTGAAATTSPYTAVMETIPVNPQPIGTFAPGQIAITTFNQGHTTDTDLWVFDSSFNPLHGHGNDDESILAGTPGTGSSLQSWLIRNYPPGTYYLALSNFNITLVSPSPSDDDFRTGGLLDFAGLVANSNSTAGSNLTFTITDSQSNSQTVPNSKPGPYDINWFVFTVGGGGASGACCMGGACSITTQAQCGGTYFGDGTSCFPDPCIPPPPCAGCGPGPHFMHQPGCPAAMETLQTGALVGIDTNLDCVADSSIVMNGDAALQRGDPQDDSNQYPGTRPIDGHLDVIDTQIISMHLVGGGVTLKAGAGQGAGGLLGATLGNVAERSSDPSLADSLFDVFFEIDLGGGNFVYNQTPLRVESTITCLPPFQNYLHPVGCIPLYTSPVPGQGVHVANLTTARHDPYPTGACCYPGGACETTGDANTCINSGGSYQGDGTECEPNPCAATGACCVGGACSITTQAQCGGVYFGDGTACAPDPCGPHQPCDGCGPGPHWIDSPPCPPGNEIIPTGALVGIDTNLDCVADSSIVMSGDAALQRTGAIDDSNQYPGTRPVDGHLDVIDTQIISMTLTGGGVTLKAGANQGAIPLASTLGNVAEQTGNPSLADSFFDVFFEVDLGGGNRVYNQTALRVDSTITCLPPFQNYLHPVGCIPLYTSPVPGQGVHVANLTTARHDPFPTGACCYPGGICDTTATANTCINSGGMYQGDGTVCEPNPCSTGGQGGCCLTDGTCVLAGELSCLQDGGVYRGDGSDCTNPCPQPCPIPPCDAWTTCTSDGPPSPSYDSFADNPIPADFFYPGSEPFTGEIRLLGAAIDSSEFGPGDTLVHRQLDPFAPNDPPSCTPGDMNNDAVVDLLDVPGFVSALLGIGPPGCADMDGNLLANGADIGGMIECIIFSTCPPAGNQVTVPIEIVALNLVSQMPIAVSGPGGPGGGNPNLWDVRVTLSTQPQQGGTLTATKTHPNGGFFDSVLPVSPRFIFTSVADPSQVRVLDAGLMGVAPVILTGQDAPWVHTADASIRVFGSAGTSFVPGVSHDTSNGTQSTPPLTEEALWAAHCVTTANCKIDLDIDSDNNNGVGLPDRSAVEDGIEMTSPGKIVCLNDDDDNNNQIEDRLESPVAGENDTVPIVMETDCQPEDPAAARWSLAWAPAAPISIWQTSNKTGAVVNGQKYPWPPPAQPYWVEGIAPGETVITFEIFLDGTNSDGKDEVKATVARIDLDARKMNHNAPNGDLDENREENPGAFVPMNNDDDDYDASNTADKDQAGAISGESDLLHIVLRPIDPVGLGGNYKLEIPASVRVWSASDRSGAVDGSTMFDATVEKTLYVEGISEASGAIKLNWTGAGGATASCDQLKVTSFKWLGPLNVPGYTIYRYTASGALGSSKWVAPSSGAIQTGNGTSDVTILWAEGPVVGKAIYEVNADYTWDLEVNVVQVKIKSTGNSATYTSNPTQVNGANSALITANGAGANCMTATITIEKVEGPLVGAGRRGVKFMEVGHVHQAAFTSKHGLYNNTNPAKRRRSSLQDGQVHWDAAVQGTLPWTFQDASHYLAPASDATVNNTVFSTFDNPTLLGTDMFTLAGDQVDVLNIVMPHNTFIAVRTRVPSVNGSADVLTQRARLDWTFNGSGTVNAGGTWTLTGTGTTGDASFAELQSGVRVPNAAANINEAFNTETWTTENQ